MNSPYGGIWGMPVWMSFRSVPQTPQARTRTRTSSSPGTGTGRSCSSKRCGATRTVACIVRGMSMRPPFAETLASIAARAAPGHGPSARPRSIEMAGGEPAALDLLECGLGRAALRHGVWTARMKTASGRRAHRIGDLAREHDALPPRPGMQRERRREERLRVRGERPRVHGVALPGLHELARAHDRHASGAIAGPRPGVRDHDGLAA